MRAFYLVHLLLLLPFISLRLGPRGSRVLRADRLACVVFSRLTELVYIEYRLLWDIIRNEGVLLYFSEVLIVLALQASQLPEDFFVLDERLDVVVVTVSLQLPLRCGSLEMKLGSRLSWLLFVLCVSAGVAILLQNRPLVVQVFLL